MTMVSNVFLMNYEVLYQISRMCLWIFFFIESDIKGKAEIRVRNKNIADAIKIEQVAHSKSSF